MSNREEKSKLPIWLLSLFGIALIVFTGFHAVEMISLGLPADKWIFGLFALAAVGGGTLLWSYYIIEGADSQPQLYTAGTILVLDVIGDGLALIGDTIFQANRNGLKVDTGITTIALIGQAIIIFCNVIAFVLVHTLSPDAIRKRKLRQVYHDLEVKKLDAIQQRASTLAQEAAEAESHAWLENEREQYRVRAKQAMPKSQAATKTEDEKRLDFISKFSLNKQIPAPPVQTEPLNGNHATKG